MNALALVHLDDGCSEQFGQLTGRRAPQEIHLEEAVLGVHEPGCKREIPSRGRLKGGAPAASRLIVTAPLNCAALIDPSSTGRLDLKRK